MPKRERLFTKSTGGIKAQMEEEGEVKKMGAKAIQTQSGRRGETGLITQDGIKKHTLNFLDMSPSEGSFFSDKKMSEGIKPMSD